MRTAWATPAELAGRLLRRYYPGITAYLEDCYAMTKRYAPLGVDPRAAVELVAALSGVDPGSCPPGAGGDCRLLRTLETTLEEDPQAPARLILAIGCAVARWHEND